MLRLPPHLLLVVVAVASCNGSPAGDPAPGQEVAANERVARSQLLEQQGDLAGALAEAEAAVTEGVGRDAAIQAAKLAILLKDHAKAELYLTPLVVADRNDAVAQYNLALVRHYQDDYNGARSGYLATLRADPRHADARYNLAVLCHRRGIAEEAKHHVAKFRESFPDDPRGAELELLLGGQGAAGPAGTDPPKSP